MASLTAGLSFLNWILRRSRNGGLIIQHEHFFFCLVATLNITLFTLAVIQHKRGNNRIWMKAPLVDFSRFVAPGRPLLRNPGPHIVNPATTSDGYDQPTTRSTADNSRLGDGSDNV